MTEPGVQSWGLAVDFGTSATAAVTVVAGEVTPLMLDGAGRMASAVFAKPDGSLLVGEHAVREAGYGLDRYLPTPKRDVGKTSVRLGGQPYAPVELIAAIMRRVLVEALARHHDVAPHSVVLTYPVAWSPTQREVLAEAVRLAARPLTTQLPDPIFVSEPVAAAQWYSVAAQHEPPAVGDIFAVYDLGGGTFDVAVLERTTDGYSVLAEGGKDPLGGHDFDYSLFRFLGDRHLRQSDPVLWESVKHPKPGDAEEGDRQLRWQTRVQWLKEELSNRTSQSTVLPGVGDPVLVTRSEFTTLIAADIDKTIDEFLTTLDDCGVSVSELAAIYRVGGSSRIPLVGERLQALSTTVPVYAHDDPKLVVALGAGIVKPPATKPDAPVEREVVQSERSRLLWDTAKAKEERGEDPAAEYQDILDEGHPDWTRRVAKLLGIVGRAFVTDQELSTVLGAARRTADALRVARARAGDLDMNTLRHRLVPNSRTPPVTDTTWAFVGSDDTITFLPGGRVRFSADSSSGAWNQRGSRLRFDSNGQTKFDVRIDGDTMTGFWYPAGGGKRAGSPVVLQRRPEGVAPQT